MSPIDYSDTESTTFRLTLGRIGKAFRETLEGTDRRSNSTSDANDQVTPTSREHDAASENESPPYGNAPNRVGPIQHTVTLILFVQFRRRPEFAAGSRHSSDHSISVLLPGVFVVGSDGSKNPQAFATVPPTLKVRDHDRHRARRIPDVARHACGLEARRAGVKSSE